jgi:hypothetical protein
VPKNHFSQETGDWFDRRGPFPTARFRSTALRRQDEKQAELAAAERLVEPRFKE